LVAFLNVFILDLVVGFDVCLIKISDFNLFFFPLMNILDVLVVKVNNLFVPDGCSDFLNFLCQIIFSHTLHRYWFISVSYF